MYTPKALGLGAYHHFREGYYVTEKHKVGITKQWFMEIKGGKGSNVHLTEKFESAIITGLVHDFDPAIRSCYDEYLDFDPQTLAWIMAIDSLFLLYHLSVLPENQLDAKTEGGVTSNDTKFTQDLFVLENQIPARVLYQVKFSLDHLSHLSIPKLFHNFCKAHSPIQLPDRQLDFQNKCRSHHLLDHMYRLILNYDFLEEIHERRKIPQPKKKKKRCKEKDHSKVFDDALTVMEIAAGMAGVSAIQKHIKFLQSVPWKQAMDLFSSSNNDAQDDDEEKQLHTVKIPSATQLYQVLEVKFEQAKVGGIINNLVDPKELTFHLPVMNLDSSSEVVLRNLLAYEADIASPGSTLVLTEYMNLMCGMVSTPKDAALLRENKIIQSGLSDKQVARLFGGIWETMADAANYSMNGKSDLQNAISELHMRYNKAFRIRFSNFVDNSTTILWKVFPTIITVLLIIVFTLQSFCNIYGCSSRWFHYQGKN